MTNSTTHTHAQASHCFCQIPTDDLIHWARERYEQQTPTIELLKRTLDQHEREVITIVCLLDVPEDQLLSLMEDVELPDHHILECRRRTLQLLDSLDIHPDCV